MVIVTNPLAAAYGQDMYSPYAAMGNEPEGMIDPNGESFESALTSSWTARYGAGGASSLPGGFWISPTMREMLDQAAWGWGHPGASGKVALTFIPANYKVVSFTGDDFMKAFWACAGRTSLAAAFATAYSSGGGGGNNSTEDEGSLDGKGVDYTYNGTSISEETTPNGLNYNRIIKYKINFWGKTTGEIDDEVHIGDHFLQNRGSGNNTWYEFKNFGDQAIAVWRFLAIDSPYEWANTEYKIGETVISAITSSKDGMNVTLPTSVLRNPALVYWISVHSHTNGVNRLSYGDPEHRDDQTRLSQFRQTYPGAQMNAYSYPYINDADDFFKDHRQK